MLIQHILYAKNICLRIFGIQSVFEDDGPWIKVKFRVCMCLICVPPGGEQGWRD